jgi:serine/threonine protein kinase
MDDLTRSSESRALNNQSPIVAVGNVFEPRSDQNIRDISEHLSRTGQHNWSKVPRIYVVLETINQIQAIGAFIDQEISDLGFPFTQQTLPVAFGDPTARHEFLDKQKMVLSKALHFEQGNKHYHFSHESDIPLVRQSELGRGAFGFVDRVRSEVSFREYARKLIPRGPNFRKDKVVLRNFENELHNLKKLSHIHTVQLVGSYTDPRFVGLIMSPVADCNLEQYLGSVFEPSLVRTFFGCLAVAIRFLHENCVRHKDIKPQNILVYRGRILITDFGISRDWSQAGHSTTSGPTTKTPRYCAPEVADYAPRNSSADIWSLGCVFLEMWTVISGSSVRLLIEYLENGTGSSSCYYLNSSKIMPWCRTISPAVSDSDGPLHWILNMLKENKEERWNAHMLTDRIQEHSESSATSFIGHCCDAIVGSPETVATFPDDETIDNNSSFLKSKDAILSGVAVNGSVDIHDMDNLRLATGMGVISSTTNGTNTSTAVSGFTKSKTPFHRPSQAFSAPGSSNSRTQSVRTRKSQPRKNNYSQYSLSQRHGKRTERKLSSMSKFVSPIDTLPIENWTSSTKISGFFTQEGNPNLPASMVDALANRLTIEQIHQYSARLRGNDRPARALRLLQLPLLMTAECMFPHVIHAVAKQGATKLKELSQGQSELPDYTLEEIATNMTPAILQGYSRYYWPNGQGETICPGKKATDKVSGMLIFGIPEWARQRLHEYHDLQTERLQSGTVHIELTGGSKILQEAGFYVWDLPMKKLTQRLQEPSLSSIQEMYWYRYWEDDRIDEM